MYAEAFFFFVTVTDRLSIINDFFLVAFVSGRVRYKFASFWNRNHALRNLQRAAKSFRAREEAEKKVGFLLYMFFSFQILLQGLFYMIKLVCTLCM